ncbi:hypothetical protein HYFRA_00002566 [Hymenoscyphus fraxineus]|uniref:Structural maintenance of chromosomes protein 5 n=1 Tax=Hymenoscyphus fraxineus TaxID=746836 RepID=A0A9N9PV71_9HELO|nr:hypothetical protein HYFRA_00002566 [Hymenoscyphus fraxineus]
MSSPSESNRRGRSEYEDDDDADNPRITQGSAASSHDSAKRARIAHSAPQRSRRQEQYDEDDEDEGSDGGEVDMSAFQPGAIVRVKLTNFITYEDAEFFPGPSLNMVIGPNGTGKSSLVCAICLGLGWGPGTLARAGKIGEFVKHGSREAFVEIELHRRPDEARNHIVRLKINRDGSPQDREWWLDNKKTSHTAVKELTKDFNIQVDNLCQFLPQEKVAEFAGSTPVNLLKETQRAAAPKEMLEQHEELKKLRKAQKDLEGQVERDRETVQRLEQRQASLRAEVQKLEELEEVQEKIRVLNNTIPFVEYLNARKLHFELKKLKEEAQQRLRTLEARLGPTLESVRRKEEYSGLIKVAVQARTRGVELAEREADQLIKSITDQEEGIENINQSIEAEEGASVKTKQDIASLQSKIRSLTSQLKAPIPDLNVVELSDKIQSKEREIRAAKAEETELAEKDRILQVQGRENRNQLTTKGQELADLDTQDGKKLSKLDQMSPETGRAWRWIQNHKLEFEKEVYGPPLISCSIKDPRYTDVIESFLRKNDFLTITVQTDADFKKLNDELYGRQKLAAFPLKMVSDVSSLHASSSLSEEELKRFGLNGWALDYIDGPEPVLAMLCETRGLNRSAIAAQDITTQQYDTILQDGRLVQFVAGKSAYSVSRRKEYGPQAVSTTTKTVPPAVWWVDKPVDGAAREAIRAQMRTLTEEFATLKSEITAARTRMAELKSVIKELEDAKTRVKDEKNRLQRAHSTRAALPDKLSELIISICSCVANFMVEREEETLEAKRAMVKEHKAKVNRFQRQIDTAVLRKAKYAIDLKSVLAKIRECHQDLLEAEIMNIEAKSDIEALKERNKDTEEHLARERAQVKEVEQQSTVAKNKAKLAREAAQEINAQEEDASVYANLSEDLTVEILEAQIVAEESKLEFLHANNPNAKRDYDLRQAELEKVIERVEEAESKLEEFDGTITRIRGVWEPALDELIGEISTAFAYNFEQIGCAGEVSVNKAEDFADWAIEIKVKFRENESLQILDAHRQSGGERSVSTIFYLMSLQSMAKAPFRVVDEINQGMDPRNERMVHERMVEIACKEHTSQYFLITPKLLTGLRYDKRMKVLCIASGEHMPPDYKRLDISKIIGIKRAIMATG